MADDKIKFTYYKEGEDNIWSSAGTSAEAYIEDVMITTKLAKTVVSVGLKPTIIPLGPESRVCKLVGTFKGNWLDRHENQTSLEFSDKNQIQVVQNVDNVGSYLGYGIKCTSGKAYLPEMGNAIWRIDEFTVTRDAKQMGQFKFSLTLGYVWQNPSESMLWSRNAANNKPQNVQFSIAGKVITDVKINCSVFKINNATFTMETSVYKENDPIIIYCNTSALPVFNGVIKHVRSKSLGVVVYEAVEIGNALYEVKCMNPAPGLFKPRQMIRNPTNSKYLTISQMANTIMTMNYKGHPVIDFPIGSVNIRGTIGSSEELPGRSIKIPPQIISGMTVGKALDNFLINQCGLYIWFDNLKKSTEAGFLRDSITLGGKYPSSKYFIESSERINDNDESFKPNYVVMFSSTGEQAAAYPTSGVVAGATCASYKLNTDLLDRGLDAYAKKIYDDLNITDKSKFRVRFPAGIVEFKEADYFTRIGDLTCDPQMIPRDYADDDPMTYPADSVWQIKEVTITSEYTDVIVGPSYRSIFDIYGSNLQLCDEAPSPTEVMKWVSSKIIAGEIPDDDGGSIA